MTKPNCLLEEHLLYLDELRESGETNMWGSPTYLREEYPILTKKESFAIVKYWMNTFQERHKSELAERNARDAYGTSDRSASE